MPPWNCAPSSTPSPTSSPPVLHSDLAFCSTSRRRTPTGCCSCPVSRAATTGRGWPALPFLIVWVFGSVIPLPIAPSLQPLQLVTALIYGLLTALAFALWPLGRAHDIPVSALFRDEVARERRWPRLVYIIAAALAV